MTIDQIVNIIKSTVKSHLPDAKILLFGSQAGNEVKPDSDYDLLLVTGISLTLKEKMALRTKIRKALLESGIRTDVLIQSESEIEFKKNLPGHIVRRIIKEAITL